MPKLQNPPQGGEKYLCLTLFLTMALSVVSAVIVIYSIVIIYVPSKIVLESNITGPVMCTTLGNERNIDTVEGCENWSSCEEWCLSKSNKECSHVWARTRELGTEIFWDGCDFTEENFVDHKCNIIEEIEDWNCKMFSSEADPALGEEGHKEICSVFDNIQVSCMSGICKNYSSVYQCTFQNRLDDIINDWSETVGMGYCHCQYCKNESVSYPGECPEYMSKCNRERHIDFNGNDTVREFCKNVECASCKAVCKKRGECFDMDSRRDPTTIGTDEYGNPVLQYYTCDQGHCMEIYDLKCERRCNEMVFNMRDKNSVIVSGEKIIIAECSARQTAETSRLNSPNPRRNTLFAACSNVTIDHEARSMITRDCVNGTWMDNNFNGGFTNYSYLMKVYGEQREDPQYRAEEISFEHDITIYNKTRLKINIEGCVNTLSEECMAFYDVYGKDGRNYTARAIYPCYYDPNDEEFVVINFNPDKTLMLLILFASIPGGIMVCSCMYMCGISKFIYVGDDGHMRLKCCGKYITGIGNVPVFDPPRKKRFQPLENADA